LVAPFLLLSDVASASHSLPPTTTPSCLGSHAAFKPLQTWGVSADIADISRRYVAAFPRGGSSMEEGDEGDQYDDEDEDSDADDEERRVEAKGAEADESEDEAEISADGVQIELKVAQYDEPLVASPLTNLFVSLGVMLLARKCDLFHPTVVRIARFSFISYVILLQLFLFYVRVQAKRNNDRTPIELKSPLSSVLQSQLGGGSEGGGNSMVKNLASSFLSSKSTVIDYDMKQARGMQSGLIFNTLFMWFLHFKMEQIQPLLIQTANGLTTMVYSPLFQIYILGRNLERPYKNAAMKNTEGATEEQQAATEDEVDDSILATSADEDGEETAESDSDGDDSDKMDNETVVVIADEIDNGKVQEVAIDEGDSGDDDDSGDD
jgi:hypothetical protein